MEEMYGLLMEKILELTEKNEETDAAALSWETGIKHGEILQKLKEMEDKNWLVTYEIDMCCGAEYIVDGLTDAGKAALEEWRK
ncbi:hypothetical protein [Anaerotignum sp.]|uniref:hypothetical protein n=1 Tax=Anaerotignum sp. TaxID=2039241 RepID=UPI002A90AA4C|nr:hypothetical protein [Anaerotignum sp.]MCI7657662.1 hypothetical protein [Clostridia bacterium]MDY5415441.1 hypothetical protein [Anaerotignum sp.]